MSVGQLLEIVSNPKSIFVETVEHQRRPGKTYSRFSRRRSTRVLSSFRYSRDILDECF